MAAIEAYPPKPGAKVQVIGAGKSVQPRIDDAPLTNAGMPRTGTNSFCAALEILLDGPAYHVGVQTALGENEDHVMTWIDVLQKRPYRSAQEKQQALNRMAKRLDGYIATADPPLSQLIPELMELYPEAKVICTERDMDTWAESMALVAKMVRPRLFRFILFWTPNARHLPRLWGHLSGIFDERYGRRTQTKEDSVAVWERHHAWLEEIVPKGKLFYVNVKDGWDPLCKALEVPVPKDVPFPRLNDSKSFEKVFRDWFVQGALRWAVVFGVGVAFIGVAVAFWMRR